MTEKRFDSIYYEDFCKVITDNGKEINPLQVADLLNDLNDENKQLRARIKRLERKIQRERISHQKEHEKWEKEIQKENEQLKKENYELHKRLGDFEPFERYMKERTSKTSVNDIIGLVKTDEPTNSVELKKELYK